MSNSLVALSRYRADLTRSLDRRGQALLAHPDPAAAMQAIEPLEAYFITKELGIEEAVPLLLHATAEQIQIFTDLDCWSGDHFDPYRLDAWLAPFAAVGAETLAQAFASLDQEMQLLFLMSTAKVYDLRLDDIPEEPAQALVPTPDGLFSLEPLPGERAVSVAVLVDALYRQSIDEAFALMLATRSETGSLTEEEAYRFRSGRVEDLGFPSPADAARLFAPPPQSPPPPPSAAFLPLPISLPALYARPLADDALLTRALGHITEHNLLERLEHNLIYLINAAVVAYGNGPQDIKHAADVASRVRDTLSLGLETLLSPAAPHPDLDNDATAIAAAELLGRWHLHDVFRHGHAKVVELARAARAFAADPVVTLWLERSYDSDDASDERLDQAFYQALLLPRPLYGGFDSNAADRVRAFASLRELALAEARLDRLNERYF